MNQKHKLPGFTIIELMLAMSFVAVMLIAVALTVIQISKLYNRGTTLRQVNQASRVLVDDFKRTFGEADIASINLSVASSNQRLCVGKYSYIWNTMDSTLDHNKFSDESEPIRLVRVVDLNGDLCKGDDLNKDIPPDDGTSIHLLTSGDRPLRILQMSIQSQAQSRLTEQGLYRITVYLGTDSIDAIKGNNQCKPPSEVDEGYFAYCSVNQFSFVVRSGVINYKHDSNG